MPSNQKAKPAEQNSEHCLLGANVKALAEGAELLALLNDAQYQQGLKPIFQSTIGEHFRHVLEHHRCLLAQMPGRVFCYDDRERDQLLEQDRGYALTTIASLSGKIVNIELDLFGIDFQVNDQVANGRVPTSLARELLFLQSHTVHHYAIIAAMTRTLGIQPMRSFGVAIATQNYLIGQSQTGIVESTPTGQYVAGNVKRTDGGDLGAISEETRMGKDKLCAR